MPDTKDTKDYLVDKVKTKFHHFPLQQELISALMDQNFKQPTQVQADSLTITLQENLKQLCILVYAYNGSGKTLSYLIPILNSLTMIPCRGKKLGKIEHIIFRPQAIIILPIKPLAQQVGNILGGILEYYQKNYKWQVDIGKMYGSQKSEGHIIVGLTVQIKKIFKSTTMDFSQLKWLVFDECDMIENTQQNEFYEMLQQLSKQNLKTNIIITSATSKKQNFRKKVQQSLTTHNLIQLDSRVQDKSLQGITHYWTQFSNDTDKIILNILSRVVSSVVQFQVIIFFNEIKQLIRFWKVLERQEKLFLLNNIYADPKGKHNLKASLIYNGCENNLNNQSQYDRMTKFRNGEFKLMLGTDIIGRGIDIRTVTLVINYSEPTEGKNMQLSPTSYIHRVGRTGRYSDEGIALVFIKNQLFIKQAEKELKVNMIQENNIDKIVEEAIQCFKRNISIKQGDQSKYRWTKKQ